MGAFACADSLRTITLTIVLTHAFTTALAPPQLFLVPASAAAGAAAAELSPADASANLSVSDQGIALSSDLKDRCVI